ncbi:MarR family transcriptional regulator [Calidifontibacter sp. DB0510]|uniref:MarR family transcriptional regulator n=2 Tax=Metallococcus carri TaxID=1656884 RepID=A0A967EAW4_9MICO|nr:MarR family transcriptional regulator [Metallococcus carri]NOP35953.1 MarR family transcriptional regulator [Calidifontibacter sp. DB2511S]
MATATSVMRVQQLLLAHYDQLLAPLELTFARYEALVLLTFSRTGSLPMGKVGERLMIHPTSATNIVQRLAAAGLVERRPNPRDGRGALASITEEGRRRMEQATALLERERFGLDGLSDADHDRLYELLGRVRAADTDGTR